MLKKLKMTKMELKGGVVMRRFPAPARRCCPLRLVVCVFVYLC